MNIGRFSCGPSDMQLREETARRNEMNARTSLRTCDDHCRTMNALVNADGVPPDFISGADATEAAALAQQPWYCVLYVAQVHMAAAFSST